MDKIALSVVEASKLVSISRSKLYLALSAGDLTGRKLGRRTVILRADLDRWVNELPNLVTPKKANLA